MTISTEECIIGVRMPTAAEMGTIKPGDILTAVVAHKEVNGVTYAAQLDDATADNHAVVYRAEESNFRLKGRKRNPALALKVRVLATTDPTREVGSIELITPRFRNFYDPTKPNDRVGLALRELGLTIHAYHTPINGTEVLLASSRRGKLPNK